MPRGQSEKSKANLTKLSTSEARKRGSAGGKASAKARQARKTLKEELIALLEEGDTQKRISVALIQQAEGGNTKAWEIIRDTVGEKPIERLNVSAVDTSTVSEMKKAISMRCDDGTDQE